MYYQYQLNFDVRNTFQSDNSCKLLESFREESKKYQSYRIRTILVKV